MSAGSDCSGSAPGRLASGRRKGLTSLPEPAGAPASNRQSGVPLVRSSARILDSVAATIRSSRNPTHFGGPPRSAVHGDSPELESTGRKEDPLEMKRRLAPGTGGTPSAAIG